MDKRKRKIWYISLRVAAFLAAALPPSIRAVALFPVWNEAKTVQVKAGLGLGAVIALAVMGIVFRDMIIGTLKKHMGFVKVLAIAAGYFLLVGLRMAAPYIPKLEDIAFWALVGGLASWGLSAVAALFRTGEE